MAAGGKLMKIYARKLISPLNKLSLTKHLVLSTDKTRQKVRKSPH